MSSQHAIKNRYLQTSCLRKLIYFDTKIYAICGNGGKNKKVVEAFAKNGRKMLALTIW